MSDVIANGEWWAETMKEKTGSGQTKPLALDGDPKSRILTRVDDLATYSSEGMLKSLGMMLTLH